VPAASQGFTRGFFGLGLAIGFGILFANVAIATFRVGGYGSFTETLSHQPELWTYALLPALFGWLFGLTHRHLEAREMVDKVREETAHRLRTANQLNELLLGALTAAIQGIVLADQNGVVKKIDVGATDMLGLTGPEALGRSMKDLVGGVEPKGEVEILRRDGSMLIVEIIAEHVKVGSEQQIVYLLRNVHEERTEQRMLAARTQELVVLGDIRKNFIAFVAQEIRSPLTAVTVLTEIVLEQARELQREEMIADAQQISAASGRVVRLADQILDLLKIEAGNISLVVEPVELPAVVGASTEGIEPKRVTIPSGIPGVLADRGRLGQVLFAMCEGLQVATIGSELEITASGEMPGHVIVSVRAAGQPASAKVVAAAFREWDKDHDFDAGLYGMNPGFGLGLPLARRFAQLMGGELTMHAKDDRDLELRLVLPASRPTSSGASLPSAAGGGSVLVVEQGTVMALAVEAGAPTLKVHRADNYHDALNSLSKIDPNVMLLSMGLPQSKSWVLLSTLKAHPALWHVPLVLAEVDPATGSVFAFPAQDVLLDPPQETLLQRMSEGLSRSGGSERARVVLFTDNDVTLRMLTRHRAFAPLEVHTTSNVAQLRTWATKRVDLLLLDLLSPTRQALVEVCGLVATGGASFGNVMALVPAAPSPDQVVELAQRLRQLHLQSAVHGAAVSERLVDAITKARTWRLRLPAAAMPGTVLVSALKE
jgi:signal transduction histidine kinase/DNA-binding response OmpR family regulator